MTRWRNETLTGSERGSVLAMGAVAVVALLIVTSLVVDLGLVRSDREAIRSAADAIAAGGAASLGTGNGVAGCEAAVGYSQVNLGSLSGFACSGFPVTCDDTTAPVSTTAALNGLAVTIVYPVSDTHTLMTPSSGGAQPLSARDGNQCDRIGVEVSQRRAALFSQVMGKKDLGTAVHSVALSAPLPGPGDIVHLLLLEPHACPVLRVNGGGSNGGVTVAAITDPLTGEVYPGRIAITSDGTAGCGSTIDTNGNHANVHAYGEPGCDAEVTPGTGLGCGVIETFAPGAPGCNPPACNGQPGTVAPLPTQSERQRTRAPFDWRYNCKPSYPASLAISGCPNNGSSGPYIDDLELLAGPGGSYSYYSDHFDCTVKPKDDFLVPIGNWFIDCYPLNVKGNLTFAGGNIIVDEDIKLGSQAMLRINENNTDTTYAWTAPSTVDIDEHSANAAFLYFKSGSLTKAGGAGLHLTQTMVYFSASSTMDMTGGAGDMVWTAPTEGPFADLALWSKSALLHKLAGSASFALDGIAFIPNGEVAFNGNSGVSAADAQFVAKSFSASGGASLHLTPKFNTSVQQPPEKDAELIR